MYREKDCGLTWRGQLHPPGDQEENSLSAAQTPLDSISVSKGTRAPGEMTHSRLKPRGMNLKQQLILPVNEEYSSKGWVGHVTRTWSQLEGYRLDWPWSPMGAS